MSITTTPTEAVADKGKEPINPHEEFRRAKRNVLLWGGLAVLLVSSMPDHPRADVAFGLARLNLPAWLMLAALTATVAFMFAGYIRARRYLRIRHSESLFETRAGEAIDTLDALISTAQDAKQDIITAKMRSSDVHHEIRNWSLSAKRTLEDFHNEIRRKIADLLSNLPTSPTRGVHASSAADQSETEHAAREWLAAVKAGAEAKIDEMQNETMGNIDAIAKLATASPTEIYNPPTDDIGRQLQRIGDLSTNLRKFHQDIAGKDKAWHFGHDTFPVYGTTLLALVIILFRLVVFVDQWDEPLAPRAEASVER